jgi:hypothetical protein
MNYSFIIIVVLFIAGVIAINYLSKLSGLRWEFNFIIMIVASVALAFFLRLLNIKSFLKILKEE